ncbi:ABC transporter permease [Kineosporia sp. NBRC 101731]|uniref:ABC transporter permease n=1 Tax=Kineosporia sp. NBRC 101731 TaxID=3032199 RepID=UPI0024A33478|nr:ABC transporter permease [Kineosporia sp. NBRC 101731]GLY27671.1 transport permease protein [Kineosporia sp. NBRC 101731]
MNDALPSTLSLGLARTGLELKEFFRLRETVVFSFSFPVILLFVFGSVFDDDLAPGVSFTQYFTAGMIASGVVLSSFQTLAIGIAVERDDGTLKRLRGTPMPPMAYFLGKIGLVLVTSVLQTAILLAVGALLFHLELPTDPMLWLRFAWVFVLGTSAGTVLGIAYSSLARSSKSAAAVVTPVVIVLQFVSGVFFVFTDLPGWMQTLGSLFPLRWLAQGMRSVFLPADFAGAEVSGSWQLGLTALILTAWLVIGTALALRTFRWQRPGPR